MTEMVSVPLWLIGAIAFCATLFGGGIGVTACAFALGRRSA
jgi:hypothetical protein